MAKARGKEERWYDVEVGKRIAAARQAANVTQAELARALGKRQSRIAAYEAGSRVPPIVIRKTAAALRVSVHFLMPNIRQTDIPARIPQQLMNFD